jgi:hypothetical protein
VLSRLFTAEALAARRRYWAVVPKPMHSAPCRLFVVFPRPFPAAALGVRHKYLIVVPKPNLAAPRR